jgi:hypothetical protein
MEPDAICYNKLIGADFQYAHGFVPHIRLAVWRALPTQQHSIALYSSAALHFANYHG